MTESQRRLGFGENNFLPIVLCVVVFWYNVSTLNRWATKVNDYTTNVNAQIQQLQKIQIQQQAQIKMLEDSIRKEALVNGRSLLNL